VSGDARSGLPPEAFAVALASMPSMGPARLRTLLEADPPERAWARANEDTGASLAVVDRAWQRQTALGIRVLLAGQPSYPARLADDPRAPAVLFCLGDPAALTEVPTAALVGTRAPTRYGIGVAAQFGADLAAAGVSVVSGLALGIDGAAHEGACGAGAPPIAVVAGGLDHVYPQRHERLWERVASTGVIVSESPAGVPTEKWRFPVRNRLLAALSDVVVVVESRHHGGSRHTVEAAMDRGVPVGAVPGSIRSATSEGTNALLADGAFPVCSSGDILIALALGGAAVSMAPGTAGGGRSSGAAATADAPRDPGADRLVYDALSPDPAPLDELVRLTGLDLAELCGGLERLARAGLARDAGGWWERA
jgi:DNA processing protein